jgi:hypothetical protein
VVLIWVAAVIVLAAIGMARRRGQIVLAALLLLMLGLMFSRLMFSLLD